MNLFLKKVELYGYALPLRWPLTTQTDEQSHRRLRCGLLLAVFDKHNRVGWGEIAPLPGLHKTSLQQAKREAKHHLKQLLHCALATDATSCCSIRKGAVLPPCVGWGIEMALAHLQRQYQNPKPVKQNTILPLNALVPPGDCSWMCLYAQKLLNRGHICLKFKVGHLAPLQAASLVQRMRSMCKAYGASMRLDVGGRWSLQQAVQFGQRIRPHWVQYVEEPVMNSQHIPQLHARTGLQCALDDTLHKVPASQWMCLRGVSAWVVKPSLLPGGLKQWHVLLQQAQKRNVHVVLSSCFESSLGLRQLACLADHLPHAPQAAGLLTSCWFATDVMPGMHLELGTTVHLPKLVQQLNAFDARSSSACRLLWQCF